MTEGPKFRKNNFDEVMADMQYKHYIDGLIEASLIKKMSNTDAIDIDTESYEEMKSLAEEFDLDASE